MSRKMSSDHASPTASSVKLTGQSDFLSVRFNTVGTQSEEHWLRHASYLYNASINQLHKIVMNDNAFTTAFTVDQTPAEAFAAINNPRAWWTGEFEGHSDK